MKLSSNTFPMLGVHKRQRRGGGGGEASCATRRGRQRAGRDHNLRLWQHPAEAGGGGGEDKKEEGEEARGKIGQHKGQQDCR